MNQKNERLSPNAICESKKSENVSTNVPKWHEFVKELKTHWKMMWRDRIDDKVRAEGIASKDYSLLLLKRGTIIIATRKYKPPDFMEILEHYQGLHNIETRVDYVTPAVGGWTRFAKDVLKKEPRFTRRMRMPPKLVSKENSQLQQKKGGRGWVHQF